MVKYTLSLILLLGFCFRFKTPDPSHSKSLKLLLGMFDSVKKVNTLRTKINALERIDNTFNTAVSEIKLQVHPRKLYFINPSKKLEILYNSEISAKATVKPHVFPYLTVHLDPNNSIMRKNQHYTIHELGFEFISKTIALTLRNEKETLDNFIYHGKVPLNGHLCHLLVFENKNYGYTFYTVKEKETATIIAYKLCVNEYLLRYKNELLNDFGYLKKGTRLVVPNLYCRKAVIYLDETRLLPVSVSLFDDEGLFESYSFSSTIVNPRFSEEDFSIKNKTYHF
jgi:hypothetical protein